MEQGDTDALERLMDIDIHPHDTNRGDNGAARKFPKWLIPLAGYAISVACLIWVYKGFDWHEELLRLRETSWKWVMLAVARISWSM